MSFHVCQCCCLYLLQLSTMEQSSVSQQCLSVLLSIPATALHYGTILSQSAMSVSAAVYTCNSSPLHYGTILSQSAMSVCAAVYTCNSSPLHYGTILSQSAMSVCAAVYTCNSSPLHYGTILSQSAMSVCAAVYTCCSSPLWNNPQSVSNVCVCCCLYLLQLSTMEQSSVSQQCLSVVLSIPATALPFTMEQSSVSQQHL